MEERELNEFASEIQDSGIRKMFIFLIRGFTGVKQELHNLNETVNNLQTVTIVQENGKRIEHNFQRSAFFQKVYDEIEELKSKDKDKVKKSFMFLSDWAKILIPILMILAIVLGLMGYHDLAEQIKNINN